MAKLYEWTQPEDREPEDGKVWLCWAGSGSINGAPMFLARRVDGRFYSANAGSYTQYESGVTHYRDAVEGP